MNDFLFLLRMSGSIWVPGSTIKDLTLEEINGHFSKCVACVQTSPPPSGKNRERRRRYKMRLFFSRLVDIRSMITVETSRISLLRERLYAVFDEEGRNNLTTLPTTNLGQNGAIIMQNPGS